MSGPPYEPFQGPLMPPAPAPRPARAGGGPAARLLFSTLAAGATFLPLPILRRAARGAAALVWWASPRLRRGLDLNAGRLLGPAVEPGRRRALCRSQLRGFADFTAEIAALGLGGPRPEDLLSGVEGPENLSRALTAGRGVVAVTLHFGNYELLAAALAGRVPAGVSILYDRDPSRVWEGRRSRWRRRVGLEEIAIDASPYFVIEALARLKRGGAVLLSGDQVESREGEQVDLLGAPAPFSSLPARLSLASEAPLLPAFSVRERDGRYLLRLEKPISPAGRGPRELTEELAAVYESYLRRFPEAWLMVRPFWCEDGAPGEFRKSSSPEISLENW